MLLKKLAILSVLCTLLLSGKGMGNDYCGSCCQDACWSGWSIYGDWLYWRVRNCGLDYALPGPVIDTGNASNNTGHVFAVEPSYDSGFRVGITKECDCLYFDAFYTHYKSEESDETHSGTALTPTRVAALGTTAVLEAKAKYEIDYDVVDIVAGYSSNPCYCFQTIFFGGFKYARIDQEFTSSYDDFSGSPPVLVKQTNDMNAYGVDLGFGAEYAIWNCFNAFGRFSYDILLGDFTRKTEQNVSATGISTNAVDVRDECWRSISVINLAIGVSSDYQFCGSCIDSITLAVGYEFHKWIDMPNFFAFGSADRVDRNPAGFGIDGVTIRLALKF